MGLEKKEFDDYALKVQIQIERFLRRVLEKLRTDAIGIIDEGKAVAWGEMRRNVRYEVYKEAMKIVGVLGVGANVPYAIFRHEGTKPHWPPLLPIQQWIIKKGLVTTNSKPITPGSLRRGKKSNVDQSIKEIRSLAFLIARKISRKGTTGLAFLKMSLNQNLSWIAGELSRLKIS